MSIGSQKSRPSTHPLVSSRSAPQLSSALTQEERAGPETQRTPSPVSPTVRVRQLHPSVSGGGSSAHARQDSPSDSPRDTKHDAKYQADPAPALGNAGRGLVRFVGTFMLDSRTTFEQETDALTAVTDSLQRSVQQQPDTAPASSGEATPREPDTSS